MRLAKAGGEYRQKSIEKLNLSVDYIWPNNRPPSKISVSILPMLIDKTM